MGIPLVAFMAAGSFTGTLNFKFSPDFYHVDGTDEVVEKLLLSRILKIGSSKCTITSTRVPFPWKRIGLLSAKSARW